MEVFWKKKKKKKKKIGRVSIFQNETQWLLQLAELTLEKTISKHYITNKFIKQKRARHNNEDKQKQNYKEYRVNSICHDSYSLYLNHLLTAYQLQKWLTPYSYATSNQLNKVLQVFSKTRKKMLEKFRKIPIIFVKTIASF